MNAYRLSGTVAEDRTITVRVPEASVGAEAEIIVLFPQPVVQASEEPQKSKPGLGEFFRLLGSGPPQKSTADEEQAFLRQLKDEWD